MQSNNSKHLLVTIAQDRFKHPEQNAVHFVGDSTINNFLDDLVQYPHAYVLACLMDRQIKAERAWMIPWHVKEALGSFDIEILGNQLLEYYKDLFIKKSLHRFNSDMAETFYNAVHQIIRDYNGDASKIWSGNPSSATVVYRFLQFKGCGIKIATMAANILARQFKIPFSDYYSIDISPDVHVFRVMKRLGLVSQDADRESIIYKARELNPEFPGIIDYSCWEIGRNYCRPHKPSCKNCPVESECKKIIVHEKTLENTPRQ